MSNTTRRCWLLVAVLGFTAAPARADFIIDANPGGDKFFINKPANPTTTFDGSVGSQSGGPVVNVMTNVNVTTGNGFANIKPDTGTLTTLTFTPVDPSLFGDFSFRAQLTDAGSVTVTVQDNQGGAPQAFSFTGLPANADFDRLGIIAVAGSAETIQSVTVSSDGFKQVKQIEFSQAAGGGNNPGNPGNPGSPGNPGGNDASAVPEPASLVLWSLLGLGLGGIGARQLRRKLSPGGGA
jgi:hypothetical protein